MTFKPMLADPMVEELLRFPMLASPKLDGVRAIVRGGVVLSRSLKPIPNEHVQRLFSKYEHFDGELIVGSPTSPDVLRTTTSGVMKKSGEPDVTFCVFDHVEFPSDRYTDRYERLNQAVHDKSLRGVSRVRSATLHTLEDLREYEACAVKLGYEGVMLRDPVAPYKFGRSTAREGGLLKVKRFTDGEFEVVGFVEREHNGNEATTSELGRTKRSSHKAGKTGRGDLGALVLKFGNTTFNCGTGFDDALRAEIWANRPKYLGQLAKIKYFAYGIKDVPKLPTFLAFRDRRDL